MNFFLYKPFTVEKHKIHKRPGTEEKIFRVYRKNYVSLQTQARGELYDVFWTLDFKFPFSLWQDLEQNRKKFKNSIQNLSCQVNN